MAWVNNSDFELFGNYTITCPKHNWDSEKLIRADNGSVIKFILNSILDSSPLLSYELVLSDIGSYYYYQINDAIIKVGCDFMKRIPNSKFYVGDKSEDGVNIALKWDNETAILFRLSGNKCVQFGDYLCTKLNLFQQLMDVFD